MDAAVEEIIELFPKLNRKLYPNTLYQGLNKSDKEEFAKQKERIIEEYQRDEVVAFNKGRELYQTIFMRRAKGDDGKFEYLPIEYQLRIFQDIKGQSYLEYLLVDSAVTKRLPEVVEVLFRETIRTERTGFRLHLRVQEQIFEHTITKEERSYFTRDFALTVADFKRINEIKYTSAGSHIAKDDLCAWCRKADAPFQFFTTPPRQFGTKTRKPIILEESVAGRGYIHAPYMINLADPEVQLKGVIEDLKEARRLGLKGVVIHTGKVSMARDKKEKSEVTPAEHQAAINRMYVNTKLVLEHATPECPLLVETPAGRGTELLDRQEEMVAFYRMFSEEEQAKLGITVDTCHIWNCDYEPVEYLEDAKRAVGSALRLVHYNDSEDPRGAGKDNHFTAGGPTRKIAEILRTNRVPKIVTGEFGYLGVKRMIAIGEWCISNKIDFVKE